MAPAAAALIRTPSRSHVCIDEHINPNVGDPRVKPTPVNVTVAGASPNTYIPTIPEVRESDTSSKFKVKMFIPIEGCPTYKKKRGH